MTILYSLADFHLVHTITEKIKNDNKLKTFSDAFYFLILNLLFDLQEDEIQEMITDTTYLKNSGLPSGHDRGIDAIYIDTESDTPIIHFFNFKYVESFDKTKNHFPSNEIDKIIAFMFSLVSNSKTIEKEINRVLFDKVLEIWEIFNKGLLPKFVIHFCSNQYHSLEENQAKRIENQLSVHNFISIEYHMMEEIIKHLTNKGRKVVNAKLRVIHKSYFDKSDGDIKALIANVEAREILRIVIDDDNLRIQSDITNYEELKNHKILEDAFEDNVRIYLKQRPIINKNIKETAISDQNS